MPIAAAVSMCNPFDLTISNANFEHGFNRIYDWNLAKSLRRILAKHAAVFATATGKVDAARAAEAKTIREFDDALTIHSFGASRNMRCRSLGMAMCRRVMQAQTAM